MLSRRLVSLENWKQCFNVCLKNCQCLSFNFNEVNTTENCELNDANTKLEPEALRKKEGVNYYELVRSYYDMKVRNLSSTCFKTISACVLKAIKNLAQADQVKVEMLFLLRCFFVLFWYHWKTWSSIEVSSSWFTTSLLSFLSLFLFFPSFSNLSEASAVSLVLF